MEESISLSARLRSVKMSVPECFLGISELATMHNRVLFDVAPGFESGRSSGISRVETAKSHGGLNKVQEALARGLSRQQKCAKVY